MSVKPTTAMILAAGRGSRLPELTAHTPKPLVAVGNQPILFTHLDRLARFGIERVVINISYLALKIVNAVNTAQATGRWPELKIIFSWEEERLETGGGIKFAAQLLGHDPILIINADSVWFGADLRPLMLVCEHHDADQADATLCLVPTSATSGLRSKGDFICDDTDKLNFPDMQDDTHSCYMGVHICNPSWITSWPKRNFSLVEPWREAAKKDRLQGVHYQGPWADMGTPQGLILAEQVLNGTVDQPAAA